MPAAASPSDDRAYLELFDAYEPLSACVTAAADRLPQVASERTALFMRTEGFDRFDSAAIRLLEDAGQKQLVDTIGLAPNDSARSEGIAGALSIFGMHSSDDDPPALRMQRMRAMALLFMQAAKIETIDCKPSQELVHLMETTTDVHP